MPGHSLMNASIRTMLAAFLAGSQDLATFAGLIEAGATPKALSNRKPEMALLADGKMLSNEQIAHLVADGVDVVRFVGIPPAKVPTAPAVAPATAPAPTTPPETGHVEAVVGTIPTANGGRIINLIETVNDPFGFLTMMPAGATSAEKKARTSLYNSFTSRTQSKVLEGYRNSLKDSGREIDKDTLSESTKAARASVGLDRLIDGVLAKKKFKVDRAKQNVDLVDSLRFHLGLNGFTMRDDEHAEALAAGVEHARIFAERAAAGLKARTLTLA